MLAEPIPPTSSIRLRSCALRAAPITDLRCSVSGPAQRRQGPGATRHRRLGRRAAVLRFAAERTDDSGAAPRDGATAQHGDENGARSGRVQRTRGDTIRRFCSMAARRMRRARWICPPAEPQRRTRRAAAMARRPWSRDGQLILRLTLPTSCGRSSPAAGQNVSDGREEK